VRRLPGEVTRRDTLALGAGAATMLVMRPALGQTELQAQVQAEIERHGSPACGSQVSRRFQAFRLCRSECPQGRTVLADWPRRWYNQNFNTFNSLNSFIFKGDAALGMELTFATLMCRPSTSPMRCMGSWRRAGRDLARWPHLSFSAASRTKFHDGTRLDAHDAAFSLNLLKNKGHPIITQQMRDVTAVEAVDDVTLIVKFAKGRGRDVPLFRDDAADFFARLLRQARVRREHDGRAARLWPL